MRRRIEIKRIIQKSSIGALKLSLSQNGFQKTTEYKVFSLYFDDTHLSSYHDHADGTSKRSKFRLRAYGDGTGTISKNIFFETKSKNGPYGSKVRTLLPKEANIPSIREDTCLKFLLHCANLRFSYQLLDHGTTHQLFPTFFITYNRQRFGCVRSQTEFNLDSHLTVTPISRLMKAQRPITTRFEVLEEKYENFDPNNRRLIDMINNISYPTAFSKYIWAIEQSIYK